MISSVLEGLTLGLVLAMMIGPVFFLIINTSIKKGFKPAAYMAAGVLLSDAFFILIAVFGTRGSSFSNYDYTAGITGGILLVTFGLISFFKKVEFRPVDDMPLPDDSGTLLIDTGKGFVMNMLNPFVLIFWLGVITALKSGRPMDSTERALFFTSVLITVFVTDLLKAYLASRLKKLVSAGRMKLMNRISGTALLLFGLHLIFKTFRAASYLP